jgi:isochorismate synthase
VRIGSLAHLRTDYTIDLNEVSFPGLGSAMLDLLHPTSAVCGMPKEPSLDFIVRNEGFDRRLFGGYLGPVNIEDETHIYVNLRCLQLFVGRAVLYAGAGITHLSDPEWEWSETEWKCRIMLDVIE